MVAGGVTKRYAILATDSAQYDFENDKVTLESPKLFYTTNNKYAFTFIGTPLFMSNFDWKQFNEPMDVLAAYLSEHLTAQRARVEEEWKNVGDDEDPRFALFVSGMHKAIPAIASFNGYKKFRPEFLWTKEPDETKFLSIHYGGEVEGKKEIFSDAAAFMELKAKRFTALRQGWSEKGAAARGMSPGLLAEILTRGIYKKADAEMKIGEKVKYAGGAVNLLLVSAGGINTMSGASPARV